MTMLALGVRASTQRERYRLGFAWWEDLVPKAAFREERRQPGMSGGHDQGVQPGKGKDANRSENYRPFISRNLCECRRDISTVEPLAR